MYVLTTSLEKSSLCTKSIDILVCSNVPTVKHVALYNTHGTVFILYHMFQNPGSITLYIHCVLVEKSAIKV